MSSPSHTVRSRAAKKRYQFLWKATAHFFPERHPAIESPTVKTMHRRLVAAKLIIARLKPSGVDSTKQILKYRFSNDAHVLDFLEYGTSQGWNKRDGKNLSNAQRQRFAKRLFHQFCVEKYPLLDFRKGNWPEYTDQMKKDFLKWLKVQRRMIAIAWKQNSPKSGLTVSGKATQDRQDERYKNAFEIVRGVTRLVEKDKYSWKRIVKPSS